MSDRPATVSGLIAMARQRFQAAGLPDAGLDARILVSGLLGLTPTELVTGESRPVAGEDAANIAQAIARRLNREPVHRILGHREFHGLDLKLSPATLEPRPDTEILVDRVLPHLRRIAAAKGGARLLDLGTGTGAIGLALVKECPTAQAVLSDISSEALSIARGNAHLNAVADRVDTVQSNWYGSIGGTFDIIVSNPPYIVSDVIETLEPEVRVYDPAAALDGGADGLDAYRAIASGAGEHLMPGGLIAVEIGYDQKEAVERIFAGSKFTLLEAARDYGGNDRALMFTRDDG